MQCAELEELVIIGFMAYRVVRSDIFTMTASNMDCSAVKEASYKLTRDEDDDRWLKRNIAGFKWWCELVKACMQTEMGKKSDIFCE